MKHDPRIGSDGSRWNLDRVYEIHQIKVIETVDKEFILMWVDLCDKFHARKCRTEEEVKEKIYKLGERV